MDAPPLRRADQLSVAAKVALYAVMLLVSLSYNFSFILIDYVRPFLVRSLHMSLERTALLYSFQAFGVILGSLCIPPLVSRWGSKMTLVLSALAMAACTACTIVSGAFTLWAAMRLMIGIALAASYISSMTLLANFFPPRLRGRLLALNMSMFSIALLVAGAIGVSADGDNWTVFLFVAAIMPVIVALLTLLFIPNDRLFCVYSDSDVAADTTIQRGEWREMLIAGRRRVTISCVVLAGLNFSGYQFYSGFITTYLLQVRHFDPGVVGWFILIDGAGTLAGSFAWGAMADRLGRRINAIGFGCTAIFIAAFLLAPPFKNLLFAIEFGYAVCLSATNCWAAYFAELFPVRLRPMGSALYHGGHVISLAAPWIVATIAGLHSLVAGMALAPLTFAAAAALWWSLPETLRRSPLYRGFDPE